MGVYFCPNCGSGGVMFHVNPGMLKLRIRQRWRPTRINRIKARLKGNLLAFFPKTHIHDIEYSIIRDGDRIRVESFNFHYQFDKAMDVLEFGSLQDLRKWIDKKDTTVGYHIGKEAAAWVRENT